MSKTRNRAIHQTWVNCFERFIAQAIARHVADFIVFDEDVGFFGQLPDNRLCFGGRDIECERLFAAVGSEIISSLGSIITRVIFQKRRAPSAGVVAGTGALNLDNVSTNYIISTIIRIFPYPIGALVFEWLIAEYGIESYKKIIINQELRKPFAENLKLSVGITLDQLYEKAAPHVVAGFKAAKGSTL